MGSNALELIDHALADLMRLREQLAGRPDLARPTVRLDADKKPLAAKPDPAAPDHGLGRFLGLKGRVSSRWQGTPSAVDAIREERNKD